jgi:hypothetical protein
MRMTRDAQVRVADRLDDMTRTARSGGPAEELFTDGRRSGAGEYLDGPKSGRHADGQLLDAGHYNDQTRRTRASQGPRTAGSQATRLPSTSSAPTASGSSSASRYGVRPTLQTTSSTSSSSERVNA